MHIIILIKYIFGYVHVRIEGFFRGKNDEPSN